MINNEQSLTTLVVIMAYISFQPEEDILIEGDIGVE